MYGSSYGARGSIWVDLASGAGERLVRSKVGAAMRRWNDNIGCYRLSRSFRMPLSRPIIPVILSGGSGTRLWPMSTPEMPKQMLALTAEQTMLQLTARRATGERFAAPIVVANARHADMVEHQLGAVEASAQ